MDGLALIFFVIGGLFVAVGVIGFFITRRNSAPSGSAPMPSTEAIGTVNFGNVDTKQEAALQSGAVDEAESEPPPRKRARQLPDTGQLIPVTPVPPPSDTGEYPVVSVPRSDDITESLTGEETLIGLLQQLPLEKQQVFLQRVAELPEAEQTSNKMRFIFDELMGLISNEALRTAQFTAYYPRQAQAKTAYGLYVYAHLPNSVNAIQTNVEMFTAQLGGTVPNPVTAEQSTKLAEGTHLTVILEADGLEFEPIAVTKKWRLPYTRFDFAFTAEEAIVGEIISGRIGILVEKIEIAHVDFSMLITAPELADKTSSEFVSATRPLGRKGGRATDNPLAAAKFTRSRPAAIYDKIFISYSREDTEVAEMYRQVQAAVGNDVFMDTHSIRAGDDWQAALANAIDEADIFQLFWSPHSAASEHVHMEWDYALKHKCNDDDCVGFIRPVYWQHPLPDPPDALSHINFRYVPFEVNTENN